MGAAAQNAATAWSSSGGGAEALGRRRSSSAGALGRRRVWRVARGARVRSGGCRVDERRREIGVGGCGVERGRGGVKREKGNRGRQRGQETYMTGGPAIFLNAGRSDA